MTDTTKPEPKHAETLERASKYISKIHAISGERGHDTTFKAAIALIHGFTLTVDEAREILATWNRTNTGGKPWSAKELEHKLEDAEKAEPEKGRGWLLKQSSSSPFTRSSRFKRTVTFPKAGGGKGNTVAIPEPTPKIARPSPAKNPQPVAGSNTDPTEVHGVDDDRTKPADRTESGNLEPIPEHRIVTSAEGLADVVTDLRGAGDIALDLETYGVEKGDALDPFKGEIRLLTLGKKGGAIWTVDLMEVGYGLGELGEAIRDATVIAHNAKFDLLWLKVKCGISPSKVIDTMTASRMLWAGENTAKGFHSLDLCLERSLKIEPEDFEGGKSDWSEPMLSAEQYRYAARDVAHLHDLTDALLEGIGKADMEEVWEMEMKLLPAVVDMESKGVGIDREKLLEFRRRSLQETGEAEKVVKEVFGKPDINLKSHQQLKKALAELGIEVGSTNKETLAGLDDEKVVSHLLHYKEIAKQAEQSKTLLDAMDIDGRIHSSFNPLGTMTGRFSSSNPNLQNIKRGELRESIIPAPGHKFVRADYSQIELRIGAAIAGEEKMLDAYEKGEDLHRKTAAIILEKPEGDVTEEERRLAKAVNFGLLFGQSAGGLVSYAKGTYGVEMTEEEAAEFRRAFFEAYPKIEAWHDRKRRKANGRLKEVRTLVGRRRLLPGDASWWDKFSTGVNTPVQGSAADGMKLAMLTLADKYPGRLVSAIHDEVILEVPEDDAEQTLEGVTRIMEEEMAEVVKGVPIIAEGKVAESYGDK